MTHEFKNIIEKAKLAQEKGIQSVLASVIALDGSSYRRPGVRMLILENGDMIGVVSGGCVEKEILLQSESVFKTGHSKVMTYDGRYRLGCEGILYILIELLEPSKAFFKAFSKCLLERKSFEIISYFRKEESVNKDYGSLVNLNGDVFPLSKLRMNEDAFLSFKQKLEPCFKLVIIGGEHDAVELCKYATLTGWDVTIVSNASETKSIEDFPGAVNFLKTSAEQLNISLIDNQSAIILMTHNFASDLRYLVTLKDTNSSYIGLLGPLRRREDLLSQLIEYCPDINDTFLDSIHGPAGLNIGAETPQEIAVSIVSEILAVNRNKDATSLSKKIGRIHAK